MTISRKKVHYPISFSNLKENALMDAYRGPYFLSPVWRVIYQEAMRGHDLLFNGLEEESSCFHPAGSFIEAENDLTEVSRRLMSAGDISEMRRIISELPFQRQIKLRRIFQLTLRHWQTNHRRSLN